MHVCLATVASYLLLSIIYNATIVVTLFFPYRARTAQLVVEDEIAEEVESVNLILLLVTSFFISKLAIWFVNLFVRFQNKALPIICEIKHKTITNSTLFDDSLPIDNEMESRG